MGEYNGTFYVRPRALPVNDTPETYICITRTRETPPSGIQSEKNEEENTITPLHVPHLDLHTCNTQNSKHALSLSFEFRQDALPQRLVPPRIEPPPPPPAKPQPIDALPQVLAALAVQGSEGAHGADRANRRR